MQKDNGTKCWDCANYSKCSWAKGRPVQGWDARKVIINNATQGCMKSYIVNECPQYEQDKIHKCTLDEIAILLGEKVSTVSSQLRRKQKNISKLLLEKGYKLYRYEDDHSWYWEKVDGYDKHI